MRKWSMEEIIAETTGKKVAATHYKTADTIICTLDDGSVYYANDAWAGVVTTPIPELIAEVEAGIAQQAAEEAAEACDYTGEIPFQIAD